MKKYLRRVISNVIEKTMASTIEKVTISAIQKVMPVQAELAMRNALNIADMRVDKGTQLLLMLKYRDMVRQDLPLPTMHEVEFRSYSQNGEDGILLYLFSVLGTTNRRCVEVCAGDGIECNTANLIINHNWKGLMYDGGPENILKGEAFYGNRRDGLKYRGPKMIRAWITRENINALIAEHGIDREIDLFSLDLDGNDYWIWEALDVVQPRVIVAEYNQSLGHRCVSSRYRPDFVWDWKSDQGVSLPALVKLGRMKGYRLVGTDRFSINAFFIRDGIGEEWFPEVPISETMVRELGDEWWSRAREPFVEV